MWRRQRTGWYYVGVRGAHRDQFNRASRSNCQQDRQPSPKPAGCPEKELTPRSKCPAPSAGSGCSDSICETRAEHAAGGTTPETRLPILLGRHCSSFRRGLKEEQPHSVARPTSDQDGDGEGAEPEQEEAMGAEPSSHLKLDILNGLDISLLPALRDLSTGASTTVNIPWPPARMERATPEWRQKASQAMALLLRGRSGEHYSNWSDALRHRPECRLDPPDTTTQRGIWTAKCITARSAGCWMDWSRREPRGTASRRR